MTDPQQQFIAEHDARIEETHRIREALTKDLDELIDPVNKDHQGARRAFIRGMFALFEAMTYRMKANALAFGSAKLEPSEVLLLEEREFSLEDNGNLKQRSPKLRTLPNLRFTLAMLVKASEIGWAPNYDGPGWAAVKESILTRDRLTHPRTLADVTVSGRRMLSASKARCGSPRHR
ncbi:MAG: hypothetical protein U1E63_17935 [Burkholderiales bacterium]